MVPGQYENYLKILNKELIPAMGCTEPIAIAFAAAKARQVLGAMPEEMVALCSGNIIKNVKGVNVPNAGGQKGIEVAALLGALAGDADLELEVISRVPPRPPKKCAGWRLRACAAVSWPRAWRICTSASRPKPAATPPWWRSRPNTRRWWT